MAFSKGKRIEDETSKRIIDLAVAIGCKEGPDALTVTRICKELSCDRRVIYNRFRDVDELNMIVASKCNEELLENARTAVREDLPYVDNLMAFVQATFTYIYERNAYFQHYTSLYQVTQEGVENEILQGLTDMIEAGKEQHAVDLQADALAAAVSIWVLLTGISSMLASDVNYKYQDGWKTMKFGVMAVYRAIGI